MARRGPFPAGFFDAELFYGGAWSPLGLDVDQSGAHVEHGARSESGEADVSSLSFTLQNGDGRYSPRNPRSPLYGQIGKNTPARVRVNLGAPWLDLEAPNARATTADTASLDITGDLDIRWWGESEDWASAADLVSKYSTTSNQRSFILRAEAGGYLTLFWSENGSTLREARSGGAPNQAAIPSWAGRVAVRAFLDVNNGAGGCTVTFYYAADLDGPWVQMGDPVPAAGTTSVFNSSAPVTIGKAPTSSAGSPPFKVHGWELYAGTSLRCSFRASSATPGATSFVDDQGRTWATSAATISNRHILAVGEVAEWPMEWSTKGAESVLTTVQGSGVTRRLGQGAEAVESVLYRSISTIAAGMVGYWPLEDGRDATAFGAAVGSRSAAKGANVQPASYEDFPGSAPIPTYSNSRVRAELDSSTKGKVQVRWVQWWPTGSPGVANATLVRVEFADGSIASADIRIDDSGTMGVFAYDNDGVQLAGSTWFAGDRRGEQLRVSLELEQNGSKVDFRYVRLEPGAPGGFVGSGQFTANQRLGRMARVIINPQYRDLGDIAVGHLTVEDAISSIYDVSAGPLVGYVGEQAGTRMKRIGAENGAELYVRGRWSTPLGDQPEETLLDILGESAAADGGILHDYSRSLGMRYRTLDSMGSQPGVVIPYEDNKVIPFRPSDDDALTRNRITVSRPAGERVTAELTTGPMSTEPAPAGVGAYKDDVTLNLAEVELVERTAWWRLHVGTWNEGRYPELGVDLADPRILADPELVRDLLSLTPGDRLVITDPPAWLPPFPVDVIIRGLSIEVGTHHVRLTWSCVPARPYRIGYWNAGHRWSGAGTVVRAPMGPTQTSLPIEMPIGTAWTHDDGDYDVLVGGEVMTVKAAGTTTLTVDRSVNGVMKSHTVGTAVELAEPSFYAR